MECMHCQFPLRVVKGGSRSDTGTSDIIYVQLLGCLNPNCDMYTGDDLNNPQNIQHRAASAPQSSVDF